MHDLIMSKHGRGDLLEAALTPDIDFKNDDDSTCYKREAQKENKFPRSHGHGMAIILVSAGVKC